MAYDWMFNQIPQGPSSPFDGLRIDPMQAALLRLGTELMQPRPVGQTSTGQVGRAVQAGVGSFFERQAAEQKGAAETKRLGLEERQVVEREKTGAVERTGAEQKIRHNEAAFAPTIKKLDQEIERMRSQGALDDAQARYYQERARLYPQELDADLMRAQAARASAAKPTAGESEARLFESTIQAMVRAEGISEDEARTRLGVSHFGRGGRTAAGVQTLDALKREWKIANPKEETETPQAYEQRASKNALQMQTQRKQQTYFEQKMDFLNKSGILYNSADEAEAAFDRYWAGAGNELPAPATSKTRREVTMSEVLTTARARGVSPAKIIDALKARGIVVKDAK